MMGEGQTKDGVKKFAEVFTPANVVFFMLLQPHFINEGEPLRDLDMTIFDPCCGQGQFGWLEAEIIINNRVKCTNSLEYMLEQVPPENRDKNYYKNVKEYAKKGRIGKECADKLLNSQISLF